MKKLNNEQLQKLTLQLDLRYFPGFGHDYVGQVLLNRHLKKVAGRYFPHDDHIELNPRLVKCPESILIGTIKRELCHYYAHHDRSNDTDWFNELLHTVGGREHTALPQYLKRHRIIYNRFYRCPTCGHEFYYRKRFLHRGCSKRCHYCADRLVEIGKPYKVVVKYSLV